MTTAYTSLLGLALPVTGELSGTWGDTVNDYITKYLDASVAGTQTISGSQTAVTLSVTTNANLSQVGSGATGSAQYNIINCTGNPASMLTVTVPAASKTYVVVNATSTNQQVKIVGAGPTTGVTLDAGEKAVVAWNGSDFIKVATSAVDGVSTISFGTTGLTPSTATSGAVTVAGTLVAANGGTGQSTYTTGDLLYATGSTALSKLGIGTNGQILTSTGTAPQWSTLSGVAVTTFSAGTTGFTPSSATSGAVTLAGTLATTNGGTGLTSFTANRVFYASSTSAIGQSANLTFDGTTLTANALTTTSTVTINGGTANGVAYLNGSKVLTTGSALSFDGTALTVGTNGLYLSGNTGGAAYMSTYAASTATELILGTSGNIPIRFIQNNTEGMRLTSTGLGIGTSSPAYKLDVVGGVVRSQSESGVNNGYLLTSNSANASARNWAVLANSNVFGDFVIRQGNSLGSDPIAGTDRLVIDSSGNLGIGTSSPAAKLTLEGTGNLSSGISVRRTNAVTYRLGMFVGDGTGGYTADENFIASLNTNLNFMGGATGTTKLATLDSSGNLGLGVTPSAWATGKAMEIGSVGNALWGALSNNFQMLAGLAYVSGNYTYQITGAAVSAYRQTSGQHQFFNAPSGTSGNIATLTQAMTLDASGNLALGTTSSLSISSGRTDFTINGSSTGAIISFANGASRKGYLYQDGTDFSLFNEVSTGVVRFGTNGTERARISSDGTFRVKGAGTAGSTDAVQFAGSAPASSLILDSSGNLGVGATSLGSFKFKASGTGGNLGGNAYFVGLFGDGSASNKGVGLGYDSSSQTGIVYAETASAASNLAFWTYSGTTWAERARITSGGYFKASDNGAYSGVSNTYHEFYQTSNSAALLVRATNGSYTNDVLTVNGDRATTNATYNLINAYNGAISGQFIVRDSGNAVNTNGSYGTISDAKMKTDIVDAGSQWADIKAIRFRKFKMKNDPTGLVQLGVVAQELEQTSPGLVDEHADRDGEGNDLGTTTKSVKTSVLLMKAAVALQEAMARIEQLEAKVAALETK